MIAQAVSCRVSAPQASRMIAFKLSAHPVQMSTQGVKDFGTMIEGHGGILDRIDSLCFAAPIFFHVARFFFDVSDQLVP